MISNGIVIVGTDGSRGAGAAVRWAAREARCRGAELHVVHAFDQTWGVAPALPVPDLLELARNHADAIVLDAELTARAVAPDLTVQRLAEPGNPVPVLLRSAGPAALVVVGHRGRGGFTSLMLGSVGQGVATHAPCPVVVVRGRADAADGPVVLGADGSQGGYAATREAFHLAAARYCPLVAVRAYVPQAGHRTPELHETERRSLDELLRPWREKYPEVPVEASVAPSAAARVLAGMSHTAQLVVVGSRGLGTVAGTVLGSVGLHLLHHADCPVMIARN